MKEKFLVTWALPPISEPLQTTLEDLDQVLGVLSAIRDNDGKLISVTCYFILVANDGKV